MELEQPLSVIPVANGYLVQPAAQPGQPLESKDVYVFDNPYDAAQNVEKRLQAMRETETNLEVLTDDD